MDRGSAMNEMLATEGPETEIMRPMWQPFGHPGETRKSPPLVIASAEGVHITDGDGRRLLDAVAGLWNVNLGYSAAPIKQAIARQLDILPYYPTFHGRTHEQAEILSHKLVEEWFAPEEMARVFFTSGGSDSMEIALRLARQYWKTQGERDRTKFISLKKGYHGTHFGASSVGGNPNSRRNYEPLLPGCFQIPTPWTYDNPFDESDPTRLAEICARLLEEEITFQGKDTVAAFIAEPVQGAGGVIVPPANFWPLVRKICDKYGVLLIADEVVTGFGRVGAECGSRAWGVKPDMMTTAKAITSGYFPFGAVLINRKIAEGMEANTNTLGTLWTGYTYTGHPVGSAAAIAALDMTRDLRLWDTARARGERLLAGLHALAKKHALIGDVRGKGLMAGLTIVSDRKTKAPADKALMQRIADGAVAEGVLVRTQGNGFILSPPLIVTDAHIDQILQALERGFAQA